MEGNSLSMTAGANTTIFGQFDRPGRINAVSFESLDFYEVRWQQNIEKI
jgi:hypothetical protein